MFAPEFVNDNLDLSKMYEKLNIIVLNNEFQHNIESLEEFLYNCNIDNKYLNMDYGKKALNDLIIQSEYLQKRGFSLGIISLDNIYVLDGRIFLIANTIVKPLIDKYYVTINEVYSKDNIFLPPELKSNELLPFTTRLTYAYYTIGKIVQHIIFNDVTKPIEEIVKYTIMESRLYECLKRATTNNPNHRYLIYI